MVQWDYNIIFELIWFLEKRTREDGSNQTNQKQTWRPETEEWRKRKLHRIQKKVKENKKCTWKTENGETKNCNEKANTEKKKRKKTKAGMENMKRSKHRNCIFGPAWTCQYWPDLRLLMDMDCIVKCKPQKNYQTKQAVWPDLFSSIIFPLKIVCSLPRPRPGLTRPMGCL